eukprot:364220-Chlamydomonas_euryale.AAC.5
MHWLLCCMCTAHAYTLKLCQRTARGATCLTRRPVPVQLPNEQALAAELRIKLGPFADTERVLYHVRASGGKLHWAGAVQQRQPLWSHAKL